MIIRPAVVADASAIEALWTPAVLNTPMTFNPVPKTANEIADMIATRGCFLVAEQDSHVVGFVTYGAFRGGPGYVHTAEHTVLVGPAVQGQGAGQALMKVAMDHARAADIHVLVAGVSGDNPRAIAFHERLGFDPVARMPEVGRRDGRWLDLVLLQKRL